MGNSAYLNRMSELQQKKFERVEQQFGLPLNKPMNGKPMGMAGSPKPEQPQEEQPDMNNMFGMTFQQMQGEDKRFDSMFGELHKLANGLRQEVESGFMPEPIARKRIEQYVQDSSKWFSQNQAGLMDNPQFAGAIEGVLKNAYEQSQGNIQPLDQEQGAPMPPQGGM